MVSKEDLEAMGILVKQCKECCRDITEEEYNSHAGYCKNCYNDRRNIEAAKRKFNNTNYNGNESKKNISNMVAKVIKTIAILSAIICVVFGLISIEDYEIYAIVFIVVSIISSIFMYAVGEIIQLLEDIKNK